jgi:hypothetical protein
MEGDIGQAAMGYSFSFPPGSCIQIRDADADERDPSRENHMDMRALSLHLNGGETIPVRIKSGEKTTLLECETPAPFLAHVTRGRWTSPLQPDTYLRGVVTSGEGAIFSLCDQFGIVADEIVRLDPDEARTLLEVIW